VQLVSGRQVWLRHSKNRGQSIVVSQAQVLGSSARHSPAAIKRHRPDTLSHVAVVAQSACVLHALVNARIPDDISLDPVSWQPVLKVRKNPITTAKERIVVAPHRMKCVV
jgi:hypothetical protein